MAIITGQTLISKLNIWKKKHDFGADAFKIALYTSLATLDSSTTVYSTTNEVSGTGYTAGGVALTNVAPVTSNGGTVITWADVTFSTVTLTDIRGALIYNTTFGNEAVYVWDFGGSIARTAANLVLRFPQTYPGVIAHV